MLIQMIKKVKNQSGVAFITALAMMFVLLAMGTSFLVVARTDIKIGQDQNDGLKALYYAEAGAHHSIAEILDGNDVTGGGIGNIPATNFDADTDDDYSVVYSGGTITSTGTEGNATRQVVLQVSTGPWSGSFQVIGDINILAPAGGTITGDVDAGGDIAQNLFNLYTINGNTSEFNASVTIPTPDYAEYAQAGNFPTENHYTRGDCSTLEADLTPPDGIYYITGNCTINAGSSGPFNLNGSLIVRGNLTINQVASSFTVTPSGSNPAIITDGSITMTSIVSATFNGLVYARDDINFTTFAFNTDINGALVAGRDITFWNVPSSTIDFDTNLSPPYFTGGGGGGVTVDAWQGHPSS